MKGRFSCLLNYLIQRKSQLEEENRRLLEEKRELTTKIAYLERDIQECSLDDLTGLFRRKRLREHANEQLLLLRRHPGRSLSLLLIDINFLKRLNSEYGHPGGDKVIVAFAQGLRKSLRDSDIIAKIGGDEFVVLLPEQDKAAATLVKDHLIRIFEEWKKEIQPAFFGAAIGVASTTVDDAGNEPKSFEQLYDEADRAMYYNKMEQRL